MTPEQKLQGLSLEEIYDLLDSIGLSSATYRASNSSIDIVINNILRNERYVNRILQKIQEDRIIKMGKLGL